MRTGVYDNSRLAFFKQRGSNAVITGDKFVAIVDRTFHESMIRAKIRFPDTALCR
jgi:hypothetical protein